MFILFNNLFAVILSSFINPVPIIFYKSGWILFIVIVWSMILFQSNALTANFPFIFIPYNNFSASIQLSAITPLAI